MTVNHLKRRNLWKMNEINHKTVFVLDHSPYFGISAESILELVATGPPISKSLWTCSVEASVEYCRIVWDLFPNGKLVSIPLRLNRQFLT